MRLAAGVIVVVVLSPALAAARLRGETVSPFGVV
jgi:hypothetical protein